MSNNPQSNANWEPGENWSTQLYDELRRLAAGQMSRLASGQTLQATALVHEAWLRLGHGQAEPHWQSRAHFFAAAAQAMRHILIDQARRRQAARHGGGMERVDLNESQIVGGAPDDELLAVHEALDRLAAHDAGKADIVRLRYFAGLSLAEVAEVLGISEPTVQRHWTYARAWLFRAIRGDTAQGKEDC